jgi:hypothetical protein
MKAVWQFLLVLIALAAGFTFLVLPMIVADRPRMNFQKNLKERASAEELHGWATDLLAPYQTNHDLSLWIEITNLPCAFRGLDKWPPSAYIYADSQARFDSAEPIPYVKVTYGSAAGHFGVVLGPTNLPTPASREHEIRDSTWARGVWFFDGQ